MTTSRWRSSLQDVETRLRRSLGIAGPINLEMEDPPRLTPVVLSDDATRPGTAESLHNRRWRVNLPIGTIAAGQRGSSWLFADGPAAPSSSRPNTFIGGVIIDEIEISAVCPGTLTHIAYLGMFLFPTALVLSPGIPVVIAANTARFTDPCRSATEVAPVGTGFDIIVPPETGGGPMVWEMPLLCNGNNRLRIKADMFLNWNSALSFGQTALSGAAPVGGLNLTVNVAGRVF